MLKENKAGKDTMFGPDWAEDQIHNLWQAKPSISLQSFIVSPSFGLKFCHFYLLILHKIISSII